MNGSRRTKARVPPNNILYPKQILTDRREDRAAARRIIQTADPETIGRMKRGIFFIRPPHAVVSSPRRSLAAGKFGGEAPA